MDCDPNTNLVEGDFIGLGSNPFPFLLWIATFQFKLARSTLVCVVTLFHFYCGLRPNVEFRAIVYVFCSNPFPFLLWIATCKPFKGFVSNTCSNPFPFLLWIATLTLLLYSGRTTIVVTLFHFYCGLRQHAHKCYCDMQFVVTLFHFYCGLRLLRPSEILLFPPSSNPFPFLLWIATFWERMLNHVTLL